MKSVESQFKGGPAVSSKKPKDLLRAIGRIEASDWNLREIEKKIHENKMGKPMVHGKEKVPNWNREQVKSCFNSKYVFNKDLVYFNNFFLVFGPSK